MDCPSEVATIIARMLERAILNIKHSGWADLGNRCAIESDHIHNVPCLLTDYTAEKLAYYWRIERSAYVAQISYDLHRCWDDLWDQLRPYVESATEQALTACMRSLGQRSLEKV